MNDLARVADQEREQLERLGLDRHGLAVAQQPVAGEVDLDPAEVDDRGRRVRPPRPAPPAGRAPGSAPSARAG